MEGRKEGGKRIEGSVNIVSGATNGLTVHSSAFLYDTKCLTQ